MKKTILFSLFFFCRWLLSAQDKAAAAIETDFRAYQSARLQEKIFVHTDKTVYLAGETIWLKIYALLEQSHRPSPVSRVAYLEFSSAGFKTILQEKIHLDSGSGSGSIQIPAGWPSGNYVLRAYTSWMKNFPAEFYFSKVLSVVSPLHGGIAGRSTGGTAANNTPASQSTPAVAHLVPEESIHFFPEGGNLLYGFESKIAFKAIGTRNEAIPCSGFIVNQHNDTLARFRSPASALHPGTGHFQLTVPAGDSLLAYLIQDGKPVRVPFPRIEMNGYTLALSGKANAYLQFTVRTPLSENNRIVYLLGHSRQLLKSIQSAPIINGQTSFTVDHNLLSDGISVFTLLDQNRKPLCERLYFKSPAHHPLQLETDRGSYGERAPVSVQLQIPSAGSGNVQADLSLAVFRLDSLQGTDAASIVSWCYLGSELQGRIENPVSYFGSAPDTVEAADDLMLTQGWRRFSWTDVFENSGSVFHFLPEEEGPVLSAHAENRETNQLASGISFLLSFPGKEFQLSTASSDSRGNLLFTAPPFSGTTLGVIMPVNQKDSIYRVDADPVYAEQPFPSSPDFIPVPKTWANVVADRALALQVENAYRPEEKRKRRPGETIDSVAFYGRPDRNYHLADFTRYPTMEEVLREFVEDVRVRKDGKSFRFRVMNLLFKTFLDDDPLLLVDGVPVFHPDKILQIDPMKISDIDVVSHRFYKGSGNFAGIVSFRSVNGDLGQTILDPGAVVVDFEGLQQEREYYAPDYQDSAVRDRPVPDYRTTIAWIPRVKTGTDGKKELRFYTSDLPGKFAVWAQGISSDGQPLSGMTVFNVKP